MDEQLLKDLLATAEADDYNWDVIMPKFPELADVDIQILKDYAETAIQKNYDYNVINPLFPELFSKGSQKKKRDGESSGEIGLLEPPITTTDTTSPTLNLEADDSSEAFKKLEANTRRIVSNISRIPLYVAENAIGFASVLSPEVAYSLQKMSPEERETAIGAVAGSMSGGFAPMSLAAPGNEASKKLLRSAEDLEKTMQEFDTGIGQDIISGRFAQGFGRLLDEAVGTLPSLALAVLPGGIAAIGAAEAAGKSRDLQARGKDLDLGTLVNAFGSGVAEGVFESVTRGLGKQVYRALKGQTKQASLQTIKNVFNGLATGFGQEGSSEVLTLLSQRLLDAVASNDEQAFNNIFSEGIDTFLIGGVVGAPLGGLAPGIRTIGQARQKKQLNSLINNSQYDNIIDAFNREKGNKAIDISKLDIINFPSSKLYLEAALKKEVKKNNITQKDADLIINNFDEATALTYELSGLNLTKEEQVKIIPLLEEKRKLESLIKGKDESLVTKERERINLLNDQISNISKQSQPVGDIEEITREDAIKALVEEGGENITITTELINKKLEELTKQKQDANKVESPAALPDEKQSAVGEAVVEGDNQPTELAGETAQAQEETTDQQGQEGQVETEVSETEIISKPIDDKFVARIKENKVVDIVDNDGNVVDDATARRLEKKIIDKQIIPLALTEFVSEARLESDFIRDIVDETKSPRQLAETIEFIQNIDKPYVDFSGKAEMFDDNTLFTPDSVKSQGKLGSSENLRKEFGQGFINTWISSTKGVSIEDGYTDSNGVFYDAQEVLNFITTYKTRPEYVETFGDNTQLLVTAKNRFTELTGLKATPANIKKVAESPSIEELQDQVFLEEERIKADKERKKRQEEIDKGVKRLTGDEKPADTEARKKFLAETKQEVEQAINKISKPFNTITPRLITLNLERFGSAVKSSITGRRKITEGIRSTPTPKVDQVVGLNNSTVIYRTIFEPNAKAYGKFNGEFDVLIDKVDRAFDKLKSKGLFQNNIKNTKKAFEIGIYLNALEAESNKVDGEFSELAPPTIESIKDTINFLKEEGNNIDAKILEESLNKFTKDGEITSDNVFSKLDDGQKQAVKVLIDINKSLLPLAKTAADRRGRSFVELKDYNHREVLYTKQKEKDVLNAEAEAYSKGAGTFAYSLIKRTKGVKPINFDPFETVKRGAQETYLDYYMTPAVVKTQQTAQALVKKYRNGNIGQKEASKALQEALSELLQITYLNSYTNSKRTVSQKFFKEAKRLAYNALLSSAPRFAAEIMGNAAMLAGQSNKVIKNAFTKYRGISMSLGAENNNKYLNILKNLSSGEIKKLGGQRGNSILNLQGETKYSDDNNILDLSNSTLDMKGPVAQKINYLLSLGPKQFYRGVSNIADFMMGGGDRVIARPVWISKFADEFERNVKKYNNEDIEFTVDNFKELQVENSKSKYLGAKYKRALDEAVSEADRLSVDIVTSSNPINVIIKNVRRPDGSTLRNYYRVANSFMANFNLNEYATTRFAVGALLKTGEISRKQAALTLAGVLARMSSYVILYKTFANYIDQFFGAPEDEEEDMSSLIKRQIVGSVATLMFRNSLGNIPALPVNLGIEYINKKYLKSLRDGAPYDAYDNSLVYSLVNLDQLGQRSLPDILAPVALGPASPIAKDVIRVYKLVGRIQNSKTPEAKKRAYDELMSVYSYDALGQLGLIPLYKDVRRINRKIFFKDYGKDDTPGKFTKEDLDRFKNNPGVQRIIRKQLELEEQRKKRIKEAQNRFKR